MKKVPQIPAPFLKPFPSFTLQAGKQGDDEGAP